MRAYDDDDTQPIVLLERATLARGSQSIPKSMLPAFVAGDWVVSPSGEEGYIAGRSLETPGAWMFVVKTGPSSWDSTVVEMMPEAFAGFTLKERKRK